MGSNAIFDILGVIDTHEGKQHLDMRQAQTCAVALFANRHETHRHGLGHTLQQTAHHRVDLSQERCVFGYVVLGSLTLGALFGQEGESHSFGQRVDYLGQDPHLLVVHRIETHVQVARVVQGIDTHRQEELLGQKTLDKAGHDTVQLLGRTHRGHRVAEHCRHRLVIEEIVNLELQSERHKHALFVGIYHRLLCTRTGTLVSVGKNHLGHAEKLRKRQTRQVDTAGALCALAACIICLLQRSIQQRRQYVVDQRADLLAVDLEGSQRLVLAVCGVIVVQDGAEIKLQLLQKSGQCLVFGTRFGTVTNVGTGLQATHVVIYRLTLTVAKRRHLAACTARFSLVELGQYFHNLGNRDGVFVLCKIFLGRNRVLFLLGKGVVVRLQLCVRLDVLVELGIELGIETVEVLLGITLSNDLVLFGAGRDTAQQRDHLTKLHTADIGADKVVECQNRAANQRRIEYDENNQTNGATNHTPAHTAALRCFFFGCHCFCFSVSSHNPSNRVSGSVGYSNTSACLRARKNPCIILYHFY